MILTILDVWPFDRLRSNKQNILGQKQSHSGSDVVHEIFFLLDIQSSMETRTQIISPVRVIGEKYPLEKTYANWPNASRSLTAAFCGWSEISYVTAWQAKNIPPQRIGHITKDFYFKVEIFTKLKVFNEVECPFIYYESYVGFFTLHMDAP